MTNFITAKARLVYDMHKHHKNFEPDWLMASLRMDFSRLYAYFMFKKGVRLDIGSEWGCHISVIKGERLQKNANLWGYNDGKYIEFQYEPSPYGNNNKHIWIDVYSEELSEIREKFGLYPRKRFHITIGRLI